MKKNNGASLSPASFDLCGAEPGQLILPRVLGGLWDTFHPVVPKYLSSNDISKHASKMVAPLHNLFST